MISYCDIEKCVFEKSPDSNSFIKLTFDSDSSIVGTSTTNSLKGNYYLSNDYFISLKIGGTKIGGESNWVSKFRTIVFDPSSKVAFKDTYMIIYYNNDNHAVVFRKI